MPESSDSSAKTGLLAPELARKALSTLTFDSTDSSPNRLTHRLSGNPEVAPELIGCLLVKRQADGELLWGVIVETEAYSQDEPACHGYRRRSPSNETLLGEPGRSSVVVSYGIHHCVNVVTDWADWANGGVASSGGVAG